MTIEILLQKYFGLNDDIESKYVNEPYEKMISFVSDLGQIVDFDSQLVICELDSIMGENEEGGSKNEKNS